MAQERGRSQVQRPLMSPENLEKKLQVSNFDPNAIIRGLSSLGQLFWQILTSYIGAQLTVVGALRALQNPALFTSEHYKQAAIAVAAGIAIRLAIAIPVRIPQKLELSGR